MDNKQKGSMNQKKTQDLAMVPQISTPTIRVHRADGKDCFVEVTSDACAIGKFKFTFKSYDATKPAGERSKATIMMYLDIADALLLSNNILNGKYAKMAVEEKKKYDAGKQKNETYYIQSCFTRMGGVSAQKLKMQGKERPDKQSLSRQIHLIPGTKALFVIKAEQGPGKENEKGLIVPQYGNGKVNAEQYVMVPLDEDGAKRLALMIQLHASAYVSSQYSSLIMSNTKVANPVKDNAAPSENSEPTNVPQDEDYHPPVSQVEEDDLPF